MPKLSTRMKIRGGQPPVTPPPKNEHTLRTYWRHCSHFYFKRIDEHDFARLDYLRRMLAATITEPKRLFYDWETFLAVTDVLGEHKTGSRIDELDHENLLKHLFIDYTYYNFPEGVEKKVATKMRQMIKEKEQLVPRNKNEKYYEAELEKQSKRLDEMIQYFTHEDSDEPDDEIERELRRQLESLEQINNRNKERVRDLTQKCHIEVRNKTVLYFVNGPEEARSQDFHNKQLLESALASIRLGNRVDLQLEFLKQQILKLDSKQVAESISKVLSCEKVRGGRSPSTTQYRFEVAFQQAMNLQNHVFPESVLLELNDMREYSLLKFYNVSLKSKFSNISHVIAGFGHIFKRRNAENSLKNRDLLDVMKRQHNESSEVVSKFAQFEVCHHCKQLYEKQFLVGCSYRSSKMGVPISTPSYTDPYLQQIVDADTTGGSQRTFANRRRNNYMSYTKRGTSRANVGSEFVCLRKYCRTCLKQSYEQVDKNGLCAFCQGVCFCTRCLRNDMITKLKTIFSQFGGDVCELQEVSLFERLAASPPEEEQEETSNRKQLRKKGRPKKMTMIRPKSSVKVYNHMRDIREQMEQCRLICHLVKRRETQKLKLFDKRFELFKNKVGQLDEDGELMKKLGAFQRELADIHSGDTAVDEHDEPQPVVQKVNPVRKKLRRMVGGLQ